MYSLDATDPGQWDAKVRGPAEAVVQAMLEGRVPDLQPANPPPGSAAAANTRSKWTVRVVGGWKGVFRRVLT